MNELRTRGVEDILIEMVDGLKGFPEAVTTAFPLASVQMTRDSYNSPSRCLIANVTEANRSATAKLGASGEKDGLTVAKFSYDGEFSSHCLHVFTQRREQEVGTLFQTRNPILGDARAFARRTWVSLRARRSSRLVISSAIS